MAGCLKARFRQCLASGNSSLIALGFASGQAMNQRRQRACPTKVELGISRPDLDRPEAGVDAGVPPDVGVVVEAGRGADLARHPAEVLEVVELGRHRRTRITA